MDNNVKTEIKNIALKLQDNYDSQKLFNVDIGEKLPNRDVIISIVNELRKITFPGYFGTENMAYVSKDNFAGSTLATIYEKLFQQIKVALFYGNKESEYREIVEKAENLTLQFLNKIPEIQALLLKDVDAELMGDPAANSKEEIIFSYPGLYAILVYRYAHVLYELKVPFIPRIMTEHAHGKTGIDINPGAQIGEYFFIDHGTGIVIGETTVIG
ncbi:MAG: hypothetical protein PUF12_03415, partial [Thermoflexaceae bacterium]|nr:hypothetical protein [Thermoflexaceae bacterium]